MDRSYLIRNSKNVPPGVRDPEQVISRLSNFWDAHGISKQALDPRGPFVDKYAAFEDDNAELETSNMSVGFEGGLSVRQMQALRSTVIRRSVHNRDITEDSYDDALLSGIDSLSPIRVSRRRNSFGSANWHEPYSTDLKSIHHLNYELKVPQSRSSKDFWNVYDNAVKLRHKDLNPDDHGTGDAPHSWVRSNIHRILNSEEGNKNLREYDSLAPTIYLSDDPKHVAVSFHRGIGSQTYNDRLDLSTGTWARLNPDEFFPS